MKQQPAQVRIATFITSVGQEALRIYNALPFEKDEDKANMDIVLQLMEHHCLSETNIIYGRFMLNRRAQAEGETFDQYLTPLKELAKTCQYGPMQDDILRDRVVVGIRDDGLRKQLLQKKDLSFRECIDRCRAYESTSAQMRDMKMKDATVHSLEARKKTLQRPQGNETRKAKETARYQPQQRKCKYCGKDHQWGRDYCPSYGKQCKECLKMHHFSRMCKSSSKRKPKGAVRKLHVMKSQTETDKDSDEFDSHDEYVVSAMTLTPQTEKVNAVRNSTTYERKLPLCCNLRLSLLL